MVTEQVPQELFIIKTILVFGFLTIMVVTDSLLNI